MSQLVLFEDKKSFRERNNEASKKSYEKKKNMLLATDFEHFCVNYLNEKNFLNSQFYHWSNVSHVDLYKSGYINSFNEHRKRCVNNFKNENLVRDVGIDFIGKNDNNFIAGQSKLYDNHVCLKDVGTWISKSYVLKKKDQNNNGLLITVNGISQELKEDLAIHDFKNINIDKREFDNYLKWKKIIVNNNDETSLILRDYQKITIENIVNHINSNNISKNVLNLTCALGKTLIIGWILKLIKPICSILIAPIRSEVDNLYQRIPNIINDNTITTLLLDSDNSSHIEILICKINECINKNKKIIIFTTMKTASEKIATFIYSDKDQNITNFLNNSFVVFDEIHQLSLNNHILLKFLNESKKTIYATATLPYILKKYCPYNNIIDKYDFKFALENKFIVDYKIMIPIKLSSYESLDDIYLLTKEHNKNLSQQAACLLSGMLLTGTRRCIVYLGKIEECKEFGKIFDTLCKEYHGKNCEVYRVNGDINFVEREKVFKNFEQGEDCILKIITTCECLNQSINLTRCDSTFITNINKNTNTIVLFQRFMRGMRVDKKNANKINHCFLWSDGEINELEECLSKLKNEMKDESFNKKIYSISQTYDSQNIKQVIEKKEEEQKKLDSCLIDWIESCEIKNLKIEGLQHFVKTEKRAPKKEEIFKYKNIEYRIGRFWEHLKNGHNNIFFNNLINDEILKENYEKTLLLKKQKDKKQLSIIEKGEGLLEFVNKENRHPKDEEEYIYKDILFKIGNFWGHIKGGRYTNILSTLLQNNILKQNYEKVQKIKEKKKELEHLSIIEKAEALLEFVNKENNIPKDKTKYTYKNITFHLGKFWNNFKHGQCKNLADILLKNELLNIDYNTFRNK